MILFLMKLCLIIYYCPIICTFYLTEWKFIYSVFFLLIKHSTLLQFCLPNFPNQLNKKCVQCFFCLKISNASFSIFLYNQQRIHIYNFIHIYTPGSYIIISCISKMEGISITIIITRFFKIEQKTRKNLITYRNPALILKYVIKKCSFSVKKFCSINN